MLHIDIRKDSIKVQPLNDKDAKLCKKKIDRIMKQQAKHETSTEKNSQPKPKGSKSRASKQKQKFTVSEFDSSEECSGDEDFQDNLEEMFASNKSGYDIRIPLYVTAAIDSVEKMRYYFEMDPSTGQSRHDPNGRCLNDGSTPLHLAVRAKKLEVVKILLENGADLSITDCTGENVLMRTIRTVDANLINTVWPYRTGDLDINHTNTDGESVLHIAAEVKWEGCMNFLLQNKADPNIQNTKSGRTPLMIAAANGDNKIAEDLLRAGAEVLVEDFDGFTCIYKAFEKKQSDMVSYLFGHISEVEKELYIKARLDYIIEPPVPDEEKTFISDMYFPLLAECTSHKELRTAFFNQKAIHRIAFKMEEHIQSVDIVISGSHLLFCIMFKFSDNVDPKFLRQYLNCKGPDLTIEVTKYYTEVWKMSERSIIAVFLPMIGLAVIPEGRTWIKKHYLSVSEYINFFKKENLKQYIAPNPEFAWCLTKGQFGKIYKVWNTFYDVVNDIQTEQREKNMNELLEEEKREKERQVKKKQKKKRKRQDKNKNGFKQLTYDADGENEVKITDGRNDIGTSCTNENAKKGDTTRKNKTPLQNTCKSNVSKVPARSGGFESDFPTLGDQWTTVQSKKQANRDKPSQLTKQANDQIKPDVHEKQTVKETRRKKHMQKLQPLIPTQAQAPVSNCTGKARWADIAKIKPKVPESYVESFVPNTHMGVTSIPKPVPFVASDFPTLDSKSHAKTVEPERQSDKAGTFTFYFHDERTGDRKEETRESPKDFVDGNTIDPTTITFLGDSMNENIVEGNIDVPFYQEDKDWTWQVLAEIGEFKNAHAEDTPYMQARESTGTDDNGHDDTNMDTAEENTGHGSRESAKINDENIYIDAHKNIPKDLNQIVTDHINWDGDYQEIPTISLSRNGSEADGLELYFEADETFVETLDNIPKWAEELDEFSDDNVMATEETVPSIFQMSDQNEIISDITDPMDRAAEDLVYTDPAIIGCGGLHRPQTQLPQSEVHTPYLVDGKQTRESRLLGNVIKTEHEDLVRHNDTETNRSHKGWSKKRRIKPKHDDIPRLSTRNWSFGDKLLENTQQLERDMSMEGVCYPESLRGETEHEETHYFPSFHTDTRLSAQIDPRHVSLMHRLQVMQLMERQNFINKSINSTQDETLFAYYASCAGVSKVEYYDLIDQKRNPTRSQIHDPLRDLILKQQNQKNQQFNDGPRPPWVHKNIPDSQGTKTDDMNDATCDKTIDNLDEAATNLYNYQSYTMGCKKFNAESQNLIVDPQTLGIPVPANTPPTTQSMSQGQANIYTIQTAQSAMQRDLVYKIQDMYKGMLKDKIKSVRWKNNLWSMRNLPVEKQLILSKMVIPADERDRCYISINRSDSTVLGFLTDGTEVAIRIIDGQTREFTQKDLQHLVDMDVSKYFMVKYRDYCFHDGLYYIALDLYEYSITDYLVHMKRECGGRDWTLARDKLIWQLLRGLEGLHQSCLTVHGELRPDNVVVDTDGNIRIAGYGMGRNVGREGPFVDYTEEEQCWLAPEVLVHKQKVSFKSDIWVAGMLTYYILSDGKNPFGTDTADIIWNIGNQGYAMDYVNEEVNHLLCLMLSVNKSERPCISEALKHPYFWGREKQLRFVIIAGSDVLRDVKAGVPMSGAVKDSMISIIGTSPCHLKLVNWITDVDPVVMREMKTFRQYKNNVVELVLFVYNCCTHFETLSSYLQLVINCRYEVLEE